MHRIRTVLLATLVAAIVPFTLIPTLVAQAAVPIVVVAPHTLEKSTNLVTASGNNNWFFYNDETDAIDNSLGSFVTGPAAAPNGLGSAQISVSGTQRRNIATYQFRNTPLSAITTLQFSTYNQSAGNGGSATRTSYLQFNVSFDGTDTWQKRLVYLPSQNGTIVSDTWQEWDARDDGDALWSWSGGTPWPDGNTDEYRTWSDITTSFPNAKIRATDSWFGFRVGEPYANGFTGNIDALKFGVSNNLKVFDFEPETPCTTTCYVDAVNGNDAFGGDTIASAKKTIQAAIDQVAPSGTVRVLPGNYSETATNRTLFDSSGPYQFGLFIGEGKTGITIVGVDASDVPITDNANAVANVTTNATNNFGPSGVFVEGDDVTIQGLHVVANVGGDNKTIEVIGNNFKLLDSKIDVAGGGSVYLGDWRFDTGTDTSHIQSYDIEGNALLHGTSIDIASGAGYSGSVANRKILDNHFDLEGADWNAISFNGSGTGVPWFVQSVGGAVITGNDFEGGTLQYIRARGTYDNTQFDWASFWNDNTFDKAVVVGPGTPGDVRGFTYTSGTYTFNNVRRIGATIQGEVVNGVNGDTVLVKQGTYVEQVKVENKSLTLVSSDGVTNTIIQAPATIPVASNPESNIVKIAGAGVTVDISGFTISGPGPVASGGGSINAGIFVRDGAHAVIHDNRILDIRDSTFDGAQNGVGIIVGRAAFSTAATAVITGNVISGYQKNGITVSNVGSYALIEDNTVTGAGPTAVIAQNGIQVSGGATGDINRNSVSGNSYSPETATSTGMLLFGSDANTSDNILSNNQAGLYLYESSGVHAGNIIDASAIGTGVAAFWGIIVDAPPPGINPAPFEDEASAPSDSFAKGSEPSFSTLLAASQVVSLTGNELTGDGTSGGVGIGAYGGYGNLDIDLTATNNDVHNFGFGVDVEQCTVDCSAAGFLGVKFNNNSISGNINDGLINIDAPTVDAESNWWGSETGPLPTGSGDKVEGNVDVDPWLCSGVDSDVDASGFQPLLGVSPDCGPVTSDVTAVPNPAAVNSSVLLTATVDDSSTGNSNIASAEYSLDGGTTWQAALMAAQDGAFDEPTEVVTASFTAAAAPATLSLCVRGTDAASSVGAKSCVSFVVNDPVAPVITLVGSNPLTVEVGSAYTNPGATATDNVDGNLTASIVVSGAVVNTNTVGSYVVTYNVSDSSGNAALQKTRTVNVVDTTKPVITLVGSNPLTVEVGSVYTNPGATATDNVDGNLTASIVVSGAVVNTNTVGSYVVTYNVSDSHGNAAVQKTRTVNVVDTTKPVITVVGSNPLTVEVGSAYTDPGATATDNVDGSLTANIVVGGAVVNTNTVGSYVVTYNVSDSHGNAAVQKTRTVNVVDTTIPVITVVGSNPLTVEVGSTYTDPGATATDNVDGSLTASIIVGGDAVNANALGSYVVTYNVTDSHGNAAVQKTRTVNVVDTTIPVITVVGDNPLVVEVGSSYTDPGATATDNVDGNLTANIVVGGDVVNANAVGNYVVTYNVSDSKGNAAVQKTRTVNVVDTSVADTTAPVITLLGDNPLTIEVGSAYTDPGATATDNIDGDLTAEIVVGGDVVNANAVGSYVVTYNVSDSSGNAAVQKSRTVNVVDSSVADTTAPVITLKGNNTIFIEIDGTYTDPGATATDNVDGDLTAEIVVGGDSVDPKALGSYVVTYDVTDSSGNHAVQKTRTVRVVDSTIPVITLRGANPLVIEVGGVYTDPGAIATDNVDGEVGTAANLEASLAISIVVGGDKVNPNVLGTYIVTYNFTDRSGNHAVQKTRTVNVVDTIAPVITLLGDNPLEVTLGDSYTEPGATALDNFDGDLTTAIQIENGIDLTKEGTYTVRYSVKDASGNSSEATRTVKVLPVTLPTTNSRILVPFIRGN